MLTKKIPRTVWILGVVSLFNDIASEMIYPIVPIFLTTVLHTPIPIFGIIEGIAEGTASLAKFIFGYLSDRFEKRKIFVTYGYSFGAISKLLIGISYSWPLVLFARFIDRVGKGLRTAPRDSILLQNTKTHNRGFIFGLHRSMDSFGAVLGPLLALLLLSLLKENMRLIFLLAFIPSVIAVFLIIIFVKEKKHQKSSQPLKISLKWSAINPSFKLFFIISIVFALGNSSDAFILLRAKSLGFTTTLVVLTYVLYNLSQTLLATPLGSLADKIGARKVYAYGLIVFSGVYLLFGIIKNPTWLWIIFPIYGAYIAATDGVSKAYISEFITEKESGTYFGLYQTGISIATFFASFVGGLLWNRFGSPSPFFYGSFMALAAFTVLSYGKLVRKL